MKKMILFVSLLALTGCEIRIDPNSPADAAAIKLCKENGGIKILSLLAPPRYICTLANGQEMSIYNGDITRALFTYEIE